MDYLDAANVFLIVGLACTVIAAKRVSAVISSIEQIHNVLHALQIAKLALKLSVLNVVRAII